MNACREILLAQQRPRVVLFRAEGSKVSEWIQNEPSDPSGVLEVDGERSEGNVPESSHRNEEDVGLLQRPSPSRDSDRLGHA